MPPSTASGHGERELRVCRNNALACREYSATRFDSGFDRIEPAIKTALFLRKFRLGSCGASHLQFLSKRYVLGHDRQSMSAGWPFVNGQLVTGGRGRRPCKDPVRPDMETVFHVPRNGYCMKFNHLIEINDPLLPLVETLTRAQLWRGLVLRAEAPTLFVPYLDGCAITNKSEAGFSRALQYGDLSISDEVTLTPQHTVHYAIPQQKDITPSSLTMTIEEPQPELLFVRFSYEDSQTEEAGSMDAFYNEFRLSAYQEADIDTIRLIRQMAQAGQLG